MGEWLHQVLGYPWIRAIDAITLHRGDLVVVNVANGWTRKQVEQMREDVSHYLPEGIQCVVMVGDIRIEVVRVVDPCTRPLQAAPATP